MLWVIKDIRGFVSSLRIHGGVVVVPVGGCKTEVRDLATGHFLHILPSAGVALGICVFDGLINSMTCVVAF